MKNFIDEEFHVLLKLLMQNNVHFPSKLNCRGPTIDGYIQASTLARLDAYSASSSSADDFIARLRGPYRALVVDDNPMFRQVLRRQLEDIGEGWQIDEAENGEACLETLGRDEGPKYDLITMDHVSVTLTLTLALTTLP